MAISPEEFLNNNVEDGVKWSRQLLLDYKFHSRINQLFSHYPGLNIKSLIIEHALLMHAGIKILPHSEIKLLNRDLLLADFLQVKYDGSVFNTNSGSKELVERKFLAFYQDKFGEDAVVTNEGEDTDDSVEYLKFKFNVDIFVDKILPAIKPTIDEMLSHKAVARGYQINSIWNSTDEFATYKVAALLDRCTLDVTRTDVFEAIVLRMFGCEFDVNKLTAEWRENAADISKINFFKFYVNIPSPKVKQVVENINADFKYDYPTAAIFGEEEASYPKDNRCCSTFYLAREVVLSDEFIKRMYLYLQENKSFVEEFKHQSLSCEVDYMFFSSFANQIFCNIGLENATSTTDIYEALILKTFGYKGDFKDFSSRFSDTNKGAGLVKFKVNIPAEDIEKVVDNINKTIGLLTAARINPGKNSFFVLKSVLISEKFNKLLTEDLAGDLDLIQQFFPDYGKETKPAKNATPMYAMAAAVPAEAEAKPAAAASTDVKSKNKPS